MGMTLDDFRRRRREAMGWINATQFFGAFNDNVFKAYVQMFIIGMYASTERSAVPLAIATIMFSLPYLFFTAYAGFLADRFSKRVVVVVLKYAELLIMATGLLAFWAGSPVLLYVLLFLMSAQSALFSPTKYSIMPEVVKAENLARANSLLVMFSFLAIILGSFLAPIFAAGSTRLLPAADGGGEGFAYVLAQMVCVLIAVAGIVAAVRITPLRPSNPDLRPDWLFPRKMWRTWQWVRKDRELAYAFGGSLMFSSLVAFLQINFIRFGVEHMRLDEKTSTFLFVFAAVGIAAGSLAAGRLSRRNIEFGTMPGGAFLLALSTFALGMMPAGPYVVGVSFITLLAGVGSGLFVVPLDTFTQLRLPQERRGEGMALNSFMSWAGILLAGVLLLLLDVAGVGPAGCFVIMTAPALVLAFVSFFMLEDFAFRLFVNVIVKMLFKVSTVGVENVPVQGPAVLIANHASYMDALLLCATSRRRIRFMMSREIYERWKLLRRAFDLYGVIPVSPKASPRQIAEALRAARKALDDGYIVCVFAEGGLTRTGTIRAFKHGYRRIVQGTDYPIIPVYLGGSWGTVYHYYKGKLVRRWFRMGLRRYRVTAMFGKKLPATTDAYKVRQAVMELSCDYFNARKSEHGSLGATFVSRMRRSWGQDFANDSTGKSLTSGRALIGSVVLARAIRKRVKDEDYIGILLPACCAGLLSNLAVALLGRGAVNLNFTSSRAAFHSSIEQCKLGTILTSRAFMERFPDLGIDERKLVYLEDLMKEVTALDKIKALLLAKFAKFRSLAGARGTNADSAALVLFSSGSTGEPKGVMLSHHNVLSMIESLQMMLATTPEDRICGTLPLFHSFGVMGTIWYPLLGRMKVSYHTNPLDAQAVIDIVRENQASMIFGTPTFLALYLRKATKEDFKSLRFVLAGAEKLKESLIKAYVEKFGIRPYEAYGATELSPGIAVSVPHGTGGGVVQEGWRDGRVGLPCPGIAMKILDPDTGEEKGVGESGLLYLKGPNVMLGYLGRPDLTAEVMQDGWYCTGDIAFIDEEGFVGLTDRLSRFSKIGGEMVPHVAVEEALLNATGLSGTVLAVCGVDDERKGERLVVLCSPECGDPDWLWEALEKQELPNIWKPARKDYYRVEAIPVLGTGKMDLAAIKKLAAECAAGQSGQRA